VHAQTRSKVELVSDLKWKKWQAQGGKCGNDTCPMTNCLNEGLRKTQRTKDTHHTSLSAEELIVMFCAEFEHTNPPKKEGTLSESGAS